MGLLPQDLVDAYGPPTVLSLSVYLAAVCIYQSVIHYFAPRGSRNMLTYWPYTLMFLS